MATRVTGSTTCACLPPATWCSFLASRATPRNGPRLPKLQAPSRIDFRLGGKTTTAMTGNGMVRPCSCPAGKLSWARGTKDKEHAMSQTPNTAIAVIGIDIGKNSFHVVGHDARGAIVLRQKWSRGQVEARLANIPPCLIGMEACVGAHHLSRKLASLGHDARLMPAKYVRPYSKDRRNDFNDAEAIAEAVQRPTMKFVATKTAEHVGGHLRIERGRIDPGMSE